MAEIKDKDRIIESLQSKLASIQVDGMFENAKEVNGVTVITAMFSGTSSTGLRNMCDKVKEHRPDIVAVFAGIDNGKATIAAVVGKEALEKGAHAGKIVKQVAQIAGGNGGGKKQQGQRQGGEGAKKQGPKGMQPSKPRPGQKSSGLRQGQKPQQPRQDKAPRPERSGAPSGEGGRPTGDGGHRRARRRSHKAGGSDGAGAPGAGGAAPSGE